MASSKQGTVTVSCPVCGKPWIVKIEASLTAKRGKPGQAVSTVRTAKPLRIPREHKSCIAKVD